MVRQYRTISSFAQTSSGGTPSRDCAAYFVGDIPWVTSSELNDSYIEDTREHISELAICNSAAKVFPPNTLLMAMYGATIGKLGILSKSAATNQACCAIFPDSSVDTRYLFYCLLSMREKIIDMGCGAGQPNISQDVIKAIEIPICSLAEQKNIAEVLDNLDALIHTLEEGVNKKIAIKHGVMQNLLTGKKRLPGFSDKWETFVFGDLFDFIPNNAFTRAQMSDNGKVKNIHYGDILTKYGAYVDGNSNAIPYISREVDLSRFADRCYLQSGDIIIADTAEDEAVGKALEVVNVNCPILAGQHTLMCRPKIKFADKFLGYYLNAACYHDQLLPYIVGTKVSSVSKASVAQTKLVVPEYAEQQAIAEILSNMDSEIDALEHKLAKYRQVKQGMMQQLLTGKIRLV